MSSSVHVDNKQNVLILGEGSTQGLDGSSLTAQKKCSVIFAENNKTFCFSLHYNGAKSYLFVNGTEIHKFKAVKQIFASTMTPFSCSVLNVNSLKCASINNQECKIRPKIININSNEPVFFPYSINVSKCSGSCNNINDP